MINAHGILLFVGGKEYYLSYDRYPWFRNAKVSDVLDVTMPDEDSLRWDAIDVDLEIDSIIHHYDKRSLRKVIYIIPGSFFEPFSFFPYRNRLPRPTRHDYPRIHHRPRAVICSGRSPSNHVPVAWT